MMLRAQTALVVCGTAAMLAQGFNLQAVNTQGVMYDDPAWAGVQQSWCKPEHAGKEDRMCERMQQTIPASQQAARCNNCKQRCQVWGDPHLAPFAGDCTTSAFFEEKMYSFYNLTDHQKNQLDIQVRVQKEASAIGDKPWIHTVVLNGVEIANKDNCVSGDATSGTVLYDQPFYMYSDKQPGTKNADVTMELVVACRFKHNVFGLDVLLTVADEGSEEHDNVHSEMFPESMSTRMFEHDSGACVDWITYGKEIEVKGSAEQREAQVLRSVNKDFNCGRCAPDGGNSGCKVMKPGDEQWTRKCSCLGQCAAFGDPYINTPFTVPQRGTSDKAREKHAKKYGTANFQIAAPPTLTVEGQVLYNAGVLYAVVIGTDPCQFMKEVEVWILKEEWKEKYFSCNKKNRLPDNFEFTKEHYDIYYYDATQVCQNGDWKHTQRKSIEIPNAMQHGNHYNQYFNAYSLGYNAVLEDSGLVYPVNINKADAKGAQRCVKRSGGGDEKLSNLFNMGTVRTILKCHRSAVAKQPYFNVCVQRNDMDLYDVVEEKKGRPETEPTSMTGYDTVLKLEQLAKTAGWCATGDFESKSGEADTLEASSFWYREAGEAKTFGPIARRYQEMLAEQGN